MRILTIILDFFKNLFGAKQGCYTECGIDKVPTLPDVNTKPVEKLPDVVITDSIIEHQFKIIGDKDYNTEDENGRIPDLEHGVNKYLLSKEFEDFMVNPENGLDLDQTEGLSRQGVIDKIKSSKATVQVRFYYSRFSRVVGYRNPGENIIYCNRKYHDSYSLQDEISNIAHEILHIIDVTGPLQGFQHDFNATARRPFSVNYRANAAIESFHD